MAQAHDLYTLLLHINASSVCVTREVGLLLEEVENTDDVLSGVERRLSRVDDSVALVDAALPALELEPLLVFRHNAKLLRLVAVLNQLLDVAGMVFRVLWVLREVVAGEMAVLALNAQLL